MQAVTAKSGTSAPLVLLTPALARAFNTQHCQRGLQEPDAPCPGIHGQAAGRLVHEDASGFGKQRVLHAPAVGGRSIQLNHDSCFMDCVHGVLLPRAVGAGVLRVWLSASHGSWNGFGASFASRAGFSGLYADVNIELYYGLGVGLCTCWCERAQRVCLWLVVEEITQLC